MPAKIIIPEEILEQAFKLYKNNISCKNVAKQLKISSTALARVLRDNNLLSIRPKNGPNAPRLTDKNYEDIRKLHRDGLGIKKIAKKLKFNYGQIKKAYLDMGLLKQIYTYPEKERNKNKKCKICFFTKDIESFCAGIREGKTRQVKAYYNTCQECLIIFGKLFSRACYYDNATLKLIYYKKDLYGAYLYYQDYKLFLDYIKIAYNDFNDPYKTSARLVIKSKNTNVQQRKRRGENDRDYIRAKTMRYLKECIFKDSPRKKVDNFLKDHLGYSSKEFKKHIFSLKEDWMIIEKSGYGAYRLSSWDDNDSSTWVWQIDHINPVANYKYNSVEDLQYKECWSLENLRPLNAKINCLDGTRGIRHNNRIIRGQEAKNLKNIITSQ